jgi:hypothetical protein
MPLVGSGVLRLAQQFRRSLVMLAAIRRCPVARSPAINRIAAIFRMKLETGVGRPLHPHHVVSLVTVDGNIQDPVAGRPNGMRAKFRHRFCGDRYTAFDLDR